MQRVVILEDPEAVAEQAAAYIASVARDAIRQRGRFIGAFSGGRTPRSMFRSLAAEALPWSGVHVVQVDERIAPEGDSERNLTGLLETLAKLTKMHSSQIHAMPVNDPDPEAGADGYSGILRDLAGTPPVLDLVHLGLGHDGHAASLVPGDAVLEVTDRDVALSGPYQGLRRMTLTYPVINRSRQIMWVVTGAEKSGALARLQSQDREIPGGCIRSDSAILFADRAAANR